MSILKAVKSFVNSLPGISFFEEVASRAPKNGPKLVKAFKIAAAGVVMLASGVTLLPYLPAIAPAIVVAGGLTVGAGWIKSMYEHLGFKYEVQKDENIKNMIVHTKGQRLVGSRYDIEYMLTARKEIKNLTGPFNNNAVLPEKVGASVQRIVSRMLEIEKNIAITDRFGNPAHFKSGAEKLVIPAVT